MAKIVVLEAEALKVVITDKKTSDQTEEAVHRLVCKQVVICGPQTRASAWMWPMTRSD
jgi:hypothetical protein